MTVLRESPWYQEILEEGIKQGQIKGQRDAILDILRVRFGLGGQTESDIVERLAKIKSSEILHELVVVATQTDNLAAFNEHLDQKISLNLIA